jgi:hypothetical protein
MSMTRTRGRAFPRSGRAQRTIHEVLADGCALVLGQRARSGHINWCVPTDAPAKRLAYLRAVFGSWGVVAGSILVATIALCGLIWLVLGESAARIAFAPGYVASWFCLAGMPYASWRRHYASRANRCANRHGASDPRVARDMQRSIPGNGSIIWQLAVSLLAGWLYVSSL